MNSGAWRATAHRVAKSQTQLKQFSTYTYKRVYVERGCASGKEPALPYRRHGFDPSVRKIPWRRSWQPTPIFLPGESHGQRSLEGYSPQSHKELHTTEAT